MSENDIRLYKIMGEMLRDIRVGSDIVLEQVADAMSVTPKTIQRYETGERKINIDTLMKITEILGVDYYEFTKNVQKRVGGDNNVNEKLVYYSNTETREMAQELYVNPDLKILFDATKELKKEDIQFVLDMVERLKK